MWMYGDLKYEQIVKKVRRMLQMIDIFAINGDVTLADRLKNYYVSVERDNNGLAGVKIELIRGMEVARILNMTYNCVYAWYHKGGIKGEKHDGHLFFDVDSLLLYLGSCPKRQLWQYETVETAIRGLERGILEEIRRVDGRSNGILDDIGRGMVTVE